VRIDPVKRIAIVAFAMLAYGLLVSDNPLLAGEVATVEVKKYKFIPEEITVKVGTTVRWVNMEKRQYHSVWFKELDEKEAEYFWPEETFERTFDEPGVYPYVCEPHEESHDMKGVVRVVP
jgi:plastocyanin